MRLPSFTRIIVEAFDKDVRGMVARIAEPINSFMLTMKNGLNKNITINDNMAGELKSLTVSGMNLDFAYSSTRRPRAVLLGQWKNESSPPGPPEAGVFLEWSYANEVITCKFHGFNTSDSYSVTLVIFED
jgi:hypothetical protein